MAYDLPEKLKPGQPQTLYLLVHEDQPEMWFVSTSPPNGERTTKFAGYPLLVSTENVIYPGGKPSRDEEDLELW